MARKTTPPKSPASPPFKITVPLPATKNNKKKKTGPAGGPKPKKNPKKKDKATKLPKQFRPPKIKDPIASGKIKPKLQEPKLLPDIPVKKGEKPNMGQVAGGFKAVNVKGGGLMEATKRLKAQGLKKGGFPDLSGDGKITMKDILMGRGVVKKPKKKAMGGSMTLEKGKLKGVKDAPEERRRERAKRVPKGLAMGVAGAVRSGARALKKAGRLALRGYGKARK
jgi:hypothetical protein